MQDRWKEFLAARLQAPNAKPVQHTANWEEKLKEIDLKYFWLEKPEFSPIIREGKDVHGNPEFMPIKESHFIGMFAKDKVEVERHDPATGKLYKTVSSAGKEWIKWPERRTYTGLTFYPGVLPESIRGYYNTWKGYLVQPREGNFDTIKAHLLDIWCQGNRKHYDYLIAFFAQFLQKPAEKTGVALVLKGGKGTGKSIIFDLIFKSILGAHYLKLDKSEQVAGRFNKHLRDKLLIVQEEALWPGDKTIEGTLKSMITDMDTFIEAKGVDGRPERFYARFVFISNEKFVVPTGFGERRFFALRTDDAKASDRAYFNNLVTAIESGEREAFMHHLLHFDYGDVDLRKAPVTKFLLEDMKSSLGTFEKWLWDMLDDQDAIYGTQKTDEEPALCPMFGEEVPSWVFGHRFTKWMEQVRFYNAYLSKSGVANNAALVKAIKAFFNCASGARDKNGHRTIAMPYLDEARRIFEQKIGFTLEWEIEADDVDDVDASLAEALDALEGDSRLQA
jgi:hypothetical protein